MSTIAAIDFDTAHYGHDADVLYLSVGDPAVHSGGGSNSHSR